MARLGVFSITEQVAAHLRGELQRELQRGRWSGMMPGRDQLAEDLEVSRKTVELALKRLEEEGLLVAQGAGRRRQITARAGLAPQLLRVAILAYEQSDLKLDYVLDLQHRLMEAGHSVRLASKSLVDLNLDAKRVARLVKETEADAWVVLAGSREVLESFVGQGVPVFALFGRRRELAIAGAGPDKARVFGDVARRLVGLGHRRIALLAMTARRLPEPGLPERMFLQELARHGIPISPYNLPDWEESPEGLQRLLDSLFKMTPPTALLIDEAVLFHAVRHHLAQRGIKVPDAVSLVCTDPDRTFTWCRPSIAHIHWDSGPVVRRVVGWAKNVANGRKDQRQTLTPAEFVEGGTMGVAAR